MRVGSENYPYSQLFYEDFEGSHKVSEESYQKKGFTRKNSYQKKRGYQKKELPEKRGYQRKELPENRLRGRIASKFASLT